ncbi:MAG TPA: long-chain fatty acid--CoA ligase [Jatrophihabitantaceae bacterium]
MTPPTTMCEAFQQTAAQHPDEIALRTNGDAVTVTWRQYADRVRAIAAGLAKLGVRPGDTVAIMMTNRPEFHLVDVAAMHLGATCFSIYNTLPAEAINYLLTNSGSQVIAVEQQFAAKVLAAADGTALEQVICVDAELDNTMPLHTLEASGDADFDFDASWQAVAPEDVLTLIYTSGTTGNPKGVELTHHNMLAELYAGNEILQVGAQDRIVTYLPHAHAADRWGSHYASVAFGIQLTCVPDHRTVLAALTEARPTVFGAVPQIWYKIQTGIEMRIAEERSPVKRRLANWAIAAGRRVSKHELVGEAAPLTAAIQHKVADRLVLSKLRHALGLDQVRAAITGAAPIAPDALEFMTAIGVPVCECWGMSELTAMATLNRPGAIRIGTVGTAMTGVELKLADDGELLARGDIVMKGYRNEPEKTAEAVDADGWMHSGDIATIDDDGYVRIVDRKKELIINAAGKNMSPANIEMAVHSASTLIGNVVAIGDNRPFNIALIVLEPDATASYAKQRGLPDGSPAALADDPALRSEIEVAVKHANERLSRVEQIKKFAILPDVWEPGSDVLTPTMKLKRRPIAERYAAEIEALYAR